MLTYSTSAIAFAIAIAAALMVTDWFIQRLNHPHNSEADARHPRRDTAAQAAKAADATCAPRNDSFKHVA